MKILNIDQNSNLGNIEVANSGGGLYLFTFPTHTIFDWYPCSIRYDYRYSVKQNKLYIILAEKLESEPYKYGVSSNSKRAESDTACCTVGEWYNHEVAEDNKKIIDFAKNNGIITPDTDYTLDDVKTGLAKVQDIMDALLKVETMEYIKKVADDDSAREEYLCSDRETRASIILEQCTKKGQELYARLGEVFVMLNVMRKLTSDKSSKPNVRWHH